MDLESLFRAMIRNNTAFRAEIGLNAEDRVLLRVVKADGEASGYIIVENTAIPAEIAAPTKPPVQRVAAQGFDAHKGMGAR
jgi:hypothetical protein